MKTFAFILFSLTVYDCRAFSPDLGGIELPPDLPTIAVGEVKAFNPADLSSPAAGDIPSFAPAPSMPKLDIPVVDLKDMDDSDDFNIKGIQLDGIPTNPWTDPYRPGLTTPVTKEAVGVSFDLEKLSQSKLDQQDCLSNCKLNKKCAVAVFCTIPTDDAADDFADLNGDIGAFAFGANTAPLPESLSGSFVGYCHQFAKKSGISLKNLATTEWGTECKSAVFHPKCRNEGFGVPLTWEELDVSWIPGGVRATYKCKAQEKYKKKFITKPIEAICNRNDGSITTSNDCETREKDDVGEYKKPNLDLTELLGAGSRFTPGEGTSSVVSLVGNNTDTNVDTGDTNVGTGATIDTGTDVDTGTNIDTGTDVDTGDTNVGTGATIDTGTDVDTGTDIDTGTNIDTVDINVDTGDTNVGTGATIDTGTNIDTVDINVDTGDTNVDTGTNIDTVDTNVDTGDINVDTGTNIDTGINISVDTGDTNVDTGDINVDTGDTNVDTGDINVDLPGTGDIDIGGPATDTDTTGTTEEDKADASTGTIQDLNSKDFTMNFEERKEKLNIRNCPPYTLHVNNGKLAPKNNWVADNFCIFYEEDYHKNRPSSKPYYVCAATDYNDTPSKGIKKVTKEKAIPDKVLEGIECLDLCSIYIQKLGGWFPALVNDTDVGTCYTYISSIYYNLNYIDTLNSLLGTKYPAPVLTSATMMI